jgi:Holliday junction resolvase RusA-like endonuclease
MIIIELTIPGQPLGKGRPRFSRKSGTTYTPQRTRSAEGVIKQFAAEAMNGRPLLTGAIKLEVDLVFAVPPSWPRKKRELALAGGPHIVAPDADNCLKLVFDSLNGVAWTDDRVVATVTVRKRYGPKPYTKIRFWEIGEAGPGFSLKHTLQTLKEAADRGRVGLDRYVTGPRR